MPRRQEPSSSNHTKAASPGQSPPACTRGLSVAVEIPVRQRRPVNQCTTFPPPISPLEGPSGLGSPVPATLAVPSPIASPPPHKSGPPAQPRRLKLQVRDNEPYRVYRGFQSPPRSPTPRIYEVPEGPLNAQSPLGSLPLPVARHRARASSCLWDYWYLRRQGERESTGEIPKLSKQEFRRYMVLCRERLVSELRESEEEMKKELAAANIACEFLFTADSWNG